MSCSRTYLRVTQPRPYDHVTFCPLCAIEVHVIRRPHDLAAHDLLTMTSRTEAAISEHLRVYHRARYSVWRWLGSRTTQPWRWLITGLGR